MNFALTILLASISSVYAGPSIVNVTSKSDFSNKLSQSNKPVVAKFFATWCGSCKQMKPIIDNIAGEYGDSYTFIAVDVDKGSALADDYNIKSLPTLVFIKNSKEVGRRTGDGSKESVIAAIKKSLD